VRENVARTVHGYIELAAQDVSHSLLIKTNPIADIQQGPSRGDYYDALTGLARLRHISKRNAILQGFPRPA
jgi:hypothetical protein